MRWKLFSPPASLQCGGCARFKMAQRNSPANLAASPALKGSFMETAMSDLPDAPDPSGPPPYPEITPNPGIEEAPQNSPTPQEDDTGRPHD